MTRVFWDTMLFVYLLENNKEYFDQVKRLLERSYERGDTLLTSCLAVGEVMAGGSGDPASAHTAQRVIAKMGFSFLPFTPECMGTFSQLRSLSRIKAPDAIHLSCAGATGVDLFLTGDTDLLKKKPRVKGIQFIADFKHPPL